MYEGVTLDCGLKIKNGEIVSSVDWEAVKKQQQELIQRINAGPQPARIAREKAAEEAKNKRRR